MFDELRELDEYSGATPDTYDECDYCRHRGVTVQETACWLYKYSLCLMCRERFRAAGVPGYGSTMPDSNPFGPGKLNPWHQGGLLRNLC